MEKDKFRHTAWHRGGHTTRFGIYLLATWAMVRFEGISRAKFRALEAAVEVDEWACIGRGFARPYGRFRGLRSGLYKTWFWSIDLYNKMRIDKCEQ